MSLKYEKITEDISGGAFEVYNLEEKELNLNDSYIKKISVSSVSICG
ncbi:MAG: hypothetical protein AB1797_03935 [bacterium]